MELSNLKKLKGAMRGKKRVGRGIGSGKGGHTSGRGNKGQKARSGSHKPWQGFEGGQVPLYKRLPRVKGFSVYGKEKPSIINLRDLNSFETGATVTPEILLETNKIERIPKSGVKILGNGDLQKKLVLKGFTFSASATKKIEESGSKVENNDKPSKIS